MNQTTTPLRAIILDNDETTGSYTILFAILEFLRQSQSISMESVAIVLRRLGTWMVKHNVFRPGIRNLLTTCAFLRKNGYVDQIIMYTNQTVVKPPSSYKSSDEFPPFLWSPPECIAYMMEQIIQEPVFDVILSRDVQITKKEWSRILDLYPDRPMDIRNMVFVDDNAHPSFILAGRIPKPNQHPSCWHRVTPYKRCLTEREIYNCVQTCFGPIAEMQDVVSFLHEYCIVHGPDTNSPPTPAVCLQILQSFQRKFWKQIKRHVPPPPPNSPIIDPTQANSTAV
jgi:hypothetical protein